MGHLRKLMSQKLRRPPNRLLVFNDFGLMLGGASAFRLSRSNSSPAMFRKLSDAEASAAEWAKFGMVVGAARCSQVARALLSDID